MDKSSAAKSQLWHLIDSSEVPCVQGLPTFTTFDPDRMAKIKAGALEERYGRSSWPQCGHIFNVTDQRNPFRSQQEHWASEDHCSRPNQPSIIYRFIPSRKGASGSRSGQRIVPHHSSDCNDQSKLQSSPRSTPTLTGTPIPSPSQASPALTGPQIPSLSQASPALTQGDMMYATPYVGGCGG